LTWSCYVIQADLELMIFLSLPSYRHVLQCPYDTGPLNLKGLNSNKRSKPVSIVLGQSGSNMQPPTLLASGVYRAV
jgi:hypothetical protein